MENKASFISFVQPSPQSRKMKLVTRNTTQTLKDSHPTSPQEQTSKEVKTSSQDTERIFIGSGEDVCLYEEEFA